MGGGELRGFYDFILRNIAISQYHIYRKHFISKRRYFSTAKTVVNQKKKKKKKKKYGHFQIQGPRIS